MIILIIGGSASQKLAANVAKELGETLCPLETKKFPKDMLESKGKLKRMLQLFNQPVFLKMKI